MNIPSHSNLAIAETIASLRPDAADPIEVKTMRVTVKPCPKSPSGYVVESDPDSITFHNHTKGVPRALQCTLVEIDAGGASVTTGFSFTGYRYEADKGMVMETSGLSATVMTIAFNFDGKQTKGQLTFYISDRDKRSLSMDPQVGNDPTTGGGH